MEIDKDSSDMPAEDQQKQQESQKPLGENIIEAAYDFFGNKPNRSAQDYLDAVALRYADISTPSAVGPDATEDEIALDNERRLAAPTTRHRRIFSVWPRDPNGDVIKPETSKLGKMTSSQLQFWGATLFDFFHVRRIPDFSNLVTVSTGSKLLAWTKAQGETYATEQIARAEREPSPEEVRPYPIERLLREMEAQTAAFHQLPSEFKGKGKAGKITFGLDQPFMKAKPTPVLQDRIPFHLLPKTLIVHDPFGMLSASIQSYYPITWDAKPDVVSVYRLEFSEEGAHHMEMDGKREKILRECYDARLQNFLKNPTAANRPTERGVLLVPQGTKTGACAPAVFFMHESPPAKKPVEEAHLYITPGQLSGTGHHSVVYNAEWELPRSLLVHDVICKKCVVEKGVAMLEAEDGPNGETRDPKWNRRTGQVVETLTTTPGLCISGVNTQGEEERDENGELVVYDLEPLSVVMSRKYQGPVRVINTGVEYRSTERGPLCQHLHKEHADSPTARVSVVAKMSLRGDDHLPLEAKNYQKFPRHFYEHWTGYHVVSPLQDPVPVGAVIPQFYGYYVPDENYRPTLFRVGEDATKGGGVQEKSTGSSRYRSPLLLIENCGKTICSIMSDMSIDDREECASLFYRLHREGWSHNSVYTRNVLYQPGPINASPAERVLNATKRRDKRQTSFRVIDFGRSGKYDIPDVMREEETRIMKTLSILHAQDGKFPKFGRP